MEFSSQYDTHFVYIQGDHNCVMDTLSHLPCLEGNMLSLHAEQRAQHPYISSLPEEEDKVTCVFSPKDDNIMNMVAVLSDTSSNITPPLTLTISADKEFLVLLCQGYEN